MSQNKRVSSRQFSTRRSFLKQSVASAGAAAAGGGLVPYFLTASRAVAATSASDRPVIGCIGVGGQGSWNMELAMRHADVAAVCDVDSNRLAEAKKKAGGKADTYDDYRKVLDRKDIQAVSIATPDHWHTKIAIEAMKAGKDVYCEKPLTLTIDEGKKICQVAKETGAVFQVGTQQRSDMDQNFLRATAIIQSGRLGKVTKATCAIGSAENSPSLPVVPPPKGLNWERWLGQAPLVEYREQSGKDAEGADLQYKSRGHYEFRWWYEYSGGKMTDWGAHHVDCACWALGLDKTGPNSVRVEFCEHPVPFEKGYPTLDDRYNTATGFRVVNVFDDAGVELTIRHDMDNGILFEGDKGRIFVSRGKLAGKPVEELAGNPLPEDAMFKAYKNSEPVSHMQNFFDCVKNRQEPMSDVFSHHRSLTNCHLANIALRLNRDLKWDPVKEAMIGDDEAQSFVAREQRKGYEIVV
jgi:predicted dehydrogenase